MMLKKVMAIILSMVMLFSATGAFAEVTTDETTDMITYTDDFEHLNITADTTLAANGYLGTYTSDVFASHVSVNNSMHLLYDSGKDGTKALKLTATSGNHNAVVTARPSATDSFDVLEISYDLKMSYHTSQSDNRVSIGATNVYNNYPMFAVEYDATTRKNYIENATTSEKLYEYDATKWYKVVIRQCNTAKKYGYIMDENGTIVAEASMDRSWSAISPAYNGAMIDSGAELIIDNVVLKNYNLKTAGPRIISAPSIANKTGVTTGIGSVSVSLDQPITTTGSKATLTAGGDTKTCTITKDDTKLYTYVVSWEGQLLGNTEYTLDLSSIKNDYGTTTAGTASYTFETAEAALVADVTSSTPANGAVEVSVDTKSMSVTFNKVMTAPATVTLTGGTTNITADVTTDDDTTFTFVWSDELAGNTTYSINLADFSDDLNATPVTTSVSFTTENTEIVKITDDFETDAAFTVNAYNQLNSSLVPTVADLPLTTGQAQQSGYTTKNENGYSGSALQLSTGGSGSGQCINGLRTPTTHTPKVDVINGENVYEKFVMTYRFNLKDAADIGTATKHKSTSDETTTGGTAIRFYAGKYYGTHFGASVAVITVESGTTKIGEPGSSIEAMADVKEDHWYNIVWTIDGSEQTFFLIDAENGSVVWNTTRELSSVGNGYNAGDAIYLVPFMGNRYLDTYVYNENQTVLIDDFTLLKIKPNRPEHKLTLTETVEKEIEGQDASFTFSFNQPVVSDKDMLSLYLEESTAAGMLANELAYSIPSIKNIDFCTQKISFSNLQNYTNYTLDYSGITATSGADLGDAKAVSLVEFMTDPAESEVSVVGDITFDSLTAGSKIAFDVYSKVARNTNIIAAFYKRSFPAALEAIEIEKGISISEGINKDITIMLGNDIDADYLMLYIWDEDADLAPLMEERTVLAPVESLDVLMIGNSLSEDAQRYLNNIAAKDGFDLNLTVKGVGGSTLEHHYANLKAELDGRTAAEAEAEMDAGTLERAIYFTYENGELQPATEDNKLLIDALKNKQYDVISLQQFSKYTDEAFEEALPYLATEIRKLQPDAEIVLYQTWSNYSSSQATRLSYFTDTIQPTLNKWADYVGANVKNITVGGEAVKIIPAGHAFNLADNYYNWCGERYKLTAGNTDASAQITVSDWFNTSRGLWRDGNHASYYGCYLASAVWYEAITGRRAPVAIGIVPKPTGSGPVVEFDEENITITEETTSYFTEPTDAEHLEKLQQLSDIAHRIVLLNNN